MAEQPTAAPTVYCPKECKEVPCWYCLGNVTQGRETCSSLIRAVISYGKAAEIECKLKEDSNDNPTRA